MYLEICRRTFSRATKFHIYSRVIDGLSLSLFRDHMLFDVVLLTIDDLWSHPLREQRPIYFFGNIQFGVLSSLYFISFFINGICDKERNQEDRWRFWLLSIRWIPHPVLSRFRERYQSPCTPCTGAPVTLTLFAITLTHLVPEHHSSECDRTFREDSNPHIS